MNRFLVLLLILIVPAISGCAALEQFAKTEGDTVSLSLDTGTVVGELFAIDDSLVYVIPGRRTSSGHVALVRRLVGVDPSLIQSIKINGYVDHSWIAGVVILEVIPAFLMGFASGSVSEGTSFDAAVTGVLLLPAVLTAGLFLSIAKSAPKAEAPMTSEKLHELRKYARYPLGVSESHLEQYRNRIGQNEKVVIR